MARVGENLPHGAFLDQLATIHHADPVAHARDGAEVVADEEDRRVVPPAEIAHEVEHRGLHGDVEAGRGLVHDQQRRLGDERHGDDDALLLAAGQLMRIAIHHRLGIGQPHLAEHRERSRPRRRRVDALVNHRHFHQLATDRHHGIQARHRILIDHGDAPSTQRAQRAVVERDEVAALEEDAPGRDVPGPPQVAHDRERHRRFAAAGLADEAERFARTQREVEPREHRHLAGARCVRDAQSLDVEQRGVSHGGRAPAAPRRGD